MLTNNDYAWDDKLASLHLADGSHRRTAPTNNVEEYGKWKARLDAHISTHIVEALAANETLRTNGDAELADLADAASRVTEGTVYFLHTEQPNPPSGTKWYFFQRIEGKRGGQRLTREESMAALTRVIHQPPGL